MLINYSSIIKQADLLDKISEDAESIAETANEVVCSVKACGTDIRHGNVQRTLEFLQEATLNNKIVGMMLENLQSNVNSYILSLVPQQESSTEEKAPAEQQKTETSKQNQPLEQVTALVDAIKTLKDLQSQAAANTTPEKRGQMTPS